MTLNTKKERGVGVSLTSVKGLLLAEAERGLKEIKKDKQQAVCWATLYLAAHIQPSRRSVFELLGSHTPNKARRTGGKGALPLSMMEAPRPLPRPLSEPARKTAIARVWRSCDLVYDKTMYRYQVFLAYRLDRNRHFYFQNHRISETVLIGSPSPPLNSSSGHLACEHLQGQGPHCFLKHSLPSLSSSEY